MKLTPLSAVLVLLMALIFVATGIHAALGQQGAPPAKGPTFSDVAPIFQARCLQCHGGAKPAKGLRLDTYENTMKGSAHEKVVVPGKPGKSELFQRITGAKKPRMPRNGPPWLNDKETALVESWIATGAM